MKAARCTFRSLIGSFGLVAVLLAGIALSTGCRSAASRAAREQQRQDEQTAKLQEKERKQAEKQRAIEQKQKQLQDSLSALSETELRYKLAGLEQAIARGTQGMNILLAQGNGLGALIAQRQVEEKVRERDAVGMELARRIATQPRSPKRDPESDGIRSTGTGFMLSNDGYMLTSLHVVEGASRIEVLHQGTNYTAQLVRRDKGADLAILRIAGTFQALPLGDSLEVKLGDRVFTMGFPKIQLQGVSPKFTEGTINSLAGYQDDAGWFQISAPVQPGNSGGPLVNEAGQVIGVIVAKISDLQNVNYAVKSSRARLLLDDLPDCKAKVSKLDVMLAPQEIADRLQLATGLILAY